MAYFDNFMNLYVHVFKEPLLSPTAYVNGPDIEISSHHPKFSFDIDPQYGSRSLY